MDGADPPGWPVPQAFQEIERLRPADLPGDAVRPQAEAMNAPVPTTRRSRPGAERHQIQRLHCSSRVSSISTTRSSVLATSARRAFVRSRLAGRGAAGDENVLSRLDGVTKSSRLVGAHDPGFDVIVEREDRDRRLADGEGRRGDHRRQQASNRSPVSGSSAGDAGEP